MEHEADRAPLIRCQQRMIFAALGALDRVSTVTSELGRVSRPAFHPKQLAGCSDLIILSNIWSCLPESRFGSVQMGEAL